MKRLHRICLFLRTLLPSLWFNFKYLPFKQAVKLPIQLYKPTFLKLNGSVVIESVNIRFGMIKLGFFTSAAYPNSGITIRNYGQIVFKGKCHIGNDTYIIWGRHGKIVFGDDFRITCGVKIISECGISFGEHVRFGWGGIAIDTNFHPLYEKKKEKFKKAFAPVIIGNNNWFGMNCLIMPGVTTPEYCIFGARTIVTRGGTYESYCVHGGSPIRVLSRNVKRIIGQDSVKNYATLI